MSQNRSTAVMAQRAEPHDSLDFFPTPPWATRALLKHVLGPDPGESVWEPACGTGDMARPLGEYFGRVYASDVFDYSERFEGQARVTDFLLPWAPPPHFDRHPPDWIITNPPFRLAEQFVLRGLEVARIGVAVLVRSAFLEGGQRWRRLYRDRPPTMIAQFVERVPIFKGRLDPKGSTATAYCWLVWRPHWERRPFIWIPPCRRALERPGDYPTGAQPAGDAPLFKESAE